MTRTRKGIPLNKMVAGIIVLTVGALLFLVLMVRLVMDNATIN